MGQHLNLRYKGIHYKYIEFLIGTDHSIYLIFKTPKSHEKNSKYKNDPTKLSIHTSGQCHFEKDGQKYERFFIDNLSDIQREYLLCYYSVADITTLDLADTVTGQVLDISSDWPAPLIFKILIGSADKLNAIGCCAVFVKDWIGIGLLSYTSESAIFTNSFLTPDGNDASSNILYLDKRNAVKAYRRRLHGADFWFTMSNDGVFTLERHAEMFRRPDVILESHNDDISFDVIHIDDPIKAKSMVKFRIKNRHGVIKDSSALELISRFWLSAEL